MTTMPQRESTIAVPDDRRKQLGPFCAPAVKASIRPAPGGSPGGRRRTPGLRREEVAMLAGRRRYLVPWLEQGREVNPSEAVLVGGGECPAVQSAGDPASVRARRADPAGSHPGDGAKASALAPAGCWTA